MLNVVMLSIVILSVAVLSVAVLSVAVLSVVILSVAMLTVIMLIVMVPLKQPVVEVRYFTSSLMLLQLSIKLECCSWPSMLFVGKARSLTFKCFTGVGSNLTHKY